VPALPQHRETAVAESSPFDDIQASLADTRVTVSGTRKTMESARKAMAEADRVLARFDAKMPWPVTEKNDGRR